MDKSIKKKESSPDDQNDSFKQLLTLQTTLQEEVALRDIFYEDRDNLLKKIEENCHDYYKMRVSIQEIYDHHSPNISNKKIKYKICEKPQDELPQCYDVLYKLLYYFHDSNDMTLKLIQNCPKESFEQLANFICNYFYVNIFSSTFLNENLLTLIYLLLEKEIDNLTLKDGKLSSIFLDPNTSFTSVLLKCLLRKDEIKTFLENVLKKVIIHTAGFLNNQKDSTFIGLDEKKIAAFLNGKNYDIQKTNKHLKNFLSLLTCDIKKSRLNLLKQKINKVNISTNNDDIENNFYVQATKETFDNLILGNEESLNEENDENSNLLSEEEILMQRKKNAILGGNVNYKKNKSSDNDFEEYFIKSGFYTKKNNPPSENNKKEIYNNLYTKELNEEFLLNLIDKEDDKDMEEYLLTQLRIIQKKENNFSPFSNTVFVNGMINLKLGRSLLEKVILIYKYHFECFKLYIDELFMSLIQNSENVPYMIKAICTIISKLLSYKFPRISSTLKIKCISEFLFGNLIIPILLNPQYNGTMMFDFTKDKKINKDRDLKIKTIIKIIQKLFSGEFYVNYISEEVPYTLFNNYFIEIMPFIIDFFSELSNSKLPVNIEKLLEIKKSNSNENKNIEFNYLKYHPEERLEHQSMCLNLKDYLSIYNIIKSNESEIIGDKTTIIYKTYKKLTYHEDNIKTKIENEEKNSTRTFIYFSKLVLDDNLSSKINSKKEQNFSFQSNLDDNENNEKFILTRVKYSINTIIKHLNVFTRSNFLIDKSESTENFIRGLSKMIRLEGFSEMLKEKKLPLEWLGLYLQSNIDSIPKNYKENNYALLYSELIEESKQNLLKIKNDDSLNTVYSKIINSEKMTDIGINNLKRITNNEKKFEIFDFILNTPIPVFMDISYESNDKITKINFREENLGNKKQNNEPIDKNAKIIKCNDIMELCNFFPDLTEINDIEDIFGFEDEIELKSSLNDYLDIINEHVENEPMFSEYNELEKKNIKIQIENFIHVQIYEKIYSNVQQVNNQLFQLFTELSWVKPNMFKGLSNIDEKMVDLIVSFWYNMNLEMSPNNKLREFEKIDLIIKNIIMLFGYDKDLYMNILVYTLIRGAPKNFFSIFRYIQVYLSDELRDENNDYLINKIKDVISKMVGFSEKDLVGVSEEQFKKNIEKVKTGESNLSN